MVVKLDPHDGKDRIKAIQAVFGFEGIGSLTMDTKDNKLTVSGDFDPVKVVNKLRKSWQIDIVSVGPAKEIDIVSVGPAKEDDGKKDEDEEDQVTNLVKAYQAYYPRPLTYYHVPYEETPSCVIC